MFIPAEVRKCVAFIGYQMADQSFRFAGTVFFVGRSIPDGGGTFPYAVTAKHVIDGIRDKGLSTTFIRLNFKDGTSGWFTVDIDMWLTHPTDHTADVAIVNISIPDGWDHLLYPITSFATDEVVTQNNISTGDEVFLTGLFAPHYGKQRNIPIVRTGNIAAMPEDPVASQIGMVDAYLIEARSIGGLSGSPVFANLGITRWIDGSLKQATSGPIFFLLGLMHGHWDLGAPDIDAIVVDSNGEKSVNMGIAIVVPSKKILETLNNPESSKRKTRRPNSSLPIRVRISTTAPRAAQVA